ncbi:MAG: HAMP domain-containing protein [Spirochaetes bacterium]|nr:HAMP domain-containing protein [Spirochaetota bacterium]
MASAIKSKLLFDHFHGNAVVSSGSAAYTKKFEKLKENNVKTVFIITSEEVALEPYMALVKLYEESGFIVKSNNIESLDPDHFIFVKNAVEDINASFRKGSCLIVSFGRSVAGAVLACFYIYSGRTVKDSLEKVRAINDTLLREKEEIGFAREFQNYLGIGSPEPDNIFEPEKYIFRPDDEGEVIEEKIQESVAQISKKEIISDSRLQEEKDKKKHKKQKADQKAETKAAAEVFAEPEEQISLPVPEEKEKDEEEYKEFKLKGKARFYSSVRFKLISITSVIIIISLSGMILLATYFFKRDNTIRVQENNLYVSQVIGLKVKSDFNAVIEKSKLIANAIMQNISAKEFENYSKLIFNNDRDFIFFGIAALSNNNSLNFIKNVYNSPLMAGSRISANDVESVHKTIGNIFYESFTGEIVVHNVSQGFGIPVIGISQPFNKDVKGGVQFILVSYVKLDRFMEAFRSATETKTYMINSKGDILAHSDSRIVVGGGNYINVPIVKQMITSTQFNEQQRYKDENGQYHLGSFNKIGIGGCGIIATVEENVAYKEVYNQQMRNIYLTVIVLSTVIIIIYFFGKKLTRPILLLLGATKKIKNGDYDVKIRPASHDEIGELTSAFVEMGKGLEEREKIKTTFGKFVNPELVERLTKSDELKLGGERKNVAIMFTDIRDFTSISEDLEPEEVVEFLNAYLTRMVECIDRTGGIVDKFIGDAIMAEWGILISRGNDTENAINSALMMRKALLEFNRDRADKKKPLIKMGCGINTGPVLAGQIGSEDRMEITVIGDAVNLASRIEALNKPFGTDIIISDDSYELVKDIFAVEKMSPILVKGKDEPQQIYAVIGRLDDPDRVGNIKELRDILGTEEMPFRRRKEDLQGKEQAEQKEQHFIEEEVKYEILTQ